MILTTAGVANKIFILVTVPLAQKIGEIVKSTNHRYILTGDMGLPNEPIDVPTNSILMNENVAKTAMAVD